MDRLYDASAFFNLLIHNTSQDRHLLGQAILDLTRYELGNAVWKNHAADQTRLLELLDNFMRIEASMYVLNMRGLGRVVLNTAVSDGLTFYDSAYVVAAEQYALELVTDDAKMQTVAHRYGIAVIGSTEV